MLNSKAADGVRPAVTHRWRRLGGGLGVLAVVSLIYSARIADGMVDFAVNHRAGQRLWMGETLYQTADGHYMFKYLPASALVYLPLSALPLDVAKAIWFAISLAALVWSFRIVRQLVPEQRVRRLWFIPALVLAKFFLRELRLGQINILVTLVMLGVARALVRHGSERPDFAPGASAALATALKPYAALLFPYLIVKGLWRSVACGLVVLAAAMAVPALFYGIRGNLVVLQEWASTLAQSTPAQLANPDNVSVAAFFAKWTDDTSGALVPTAVVLALLAGVMLAVVIRGRGLARAPVLEMAMVLTLIPLVSPMGWDYTFLMALLAVTLLVNYFGEFPGPARVALGVNFAVIGLAVYDIMGRQAYATFMQWSVTTVNFLVVVAGLAYLRLRRVC